MYSRIHLSAIAWATQLLKAPDMPIIHLLFCFFISGFGAYLIGRNALAFGEALKVMDYPDVAGGRKRHDFPTPLVGGIVVLCGTALTAPLYIYLMDISVLQDRQISVIAFVTAVFALLGFIDDRHPLSPKIRLLILVLLSAAVLTNEPALTISFLHFSMLSNAYILGDWGIIFTMVSLVGLANAINMADGKNGLVIGLSLIWTVTLIAIGAPILAPILWALAAALLAAFYFNIRGSLFLGDAGSFGLAALIGLATIYSYTQNFVMMPAEIAVAMFLVPVIDCLRLMVNRILKGKSPFSAGRDHLHHYIAMRIGWPVGLAVYLALVGLPLLVSCAASEFAAIALLVQFLGYWAVLLGCVYGAKSKEPEPAL